MIRGCFNLPHVGPHPGTVWLVGFVAIGFAVGRWLGLLLMLVFLLPLYLYGAHEREKLSDRLEAGVPHRNREEK